tara:strand:+ start:35574 stop:35906 length:333 start_codon:yes stop_codon:yes gene_type:complete
MLSAKDLTSGERLLITRRRDGMTKAECAEGCGVTLYRYNRWEADREEGITARTGRLAFHEQSFLLRRRAKASVADFAALVGVSPWWLRQMEIGEAPDDRLRAYWDAAGAA